MDLDLVRDSIVRFVHEDVGRGDVTTKAVVPDDADGKARIEARGEFVVAGLEVAASCFEIVGPGTVTWSNIASDGQTTFAGEVLALLHGSLHTILTGERTALNLLGRLSGVATLTSEFVRAIEGTPARIVDTRKTTPGLRALERYAVQVGGGHNHRFNLADGVLIKDNHLAAGRARGLTLTQVVAAARAGAPHTHRIEVEVTSYDEAGEAVEAGADVILLDNMTPPEMARCVQMIAGRALTEASGGVTLANVRAIAESGVDIISSGALTHSAPALDISLDVETS
jgi:nicotinate-nucleotide pyrophosphorylase (carboxylating)